MASLTGQTIQSTYDSLLKISGNDPLTASLQRITDGLGNFTPLYLSTTAVEISSGLNVVGSITGSNLSGTNTGDETNSSIKTKLGAASASQDGYLTSTDWSTFNAKQPALGYTPVPQTRTLTINGTTFDLSADRSWTIASGVTSFNTRTGAITLTSGDVTGALGYTPYNATNPSGYITLGSLSASFPLVYNNLTGAFTIAQASSVQGGFLSSTDWSTFNNKLSTAILALNGLTSVSQSLQTGSAGTDFAISSSGSIHTFNIPTASGSARGLLSSSDWTSFNSKVSSQWTTSGSNIYYNTGNVGIGTSSPAGKLHVSGGDSLFGNGNLTRILSASQIIDFTNAAQDTYVAGRINGLSLKLYGNNGTGIDVTSSGNIGIGTTSPAERLHLFAPAGTSAKFVLEEGGAQSVLWTTRNSSTNGDLRFQTMIGGTVATRMLIDYSGNVGIGTTIPGERLAVNGSVGLQNSGTQYWHIRTNSSAGLEFVRSGISERMVITDGGNVGIGTTSPTSLLDVVTSGSAVGGIRLSSSTNTNGVGFLAANAGGNAYFGKNNSTGGAYGGEAYATVVYSGGAVPMSFYTNDAERMRITSDGALVLANSDSRLRGGDSAGRLIVGNSDTTSYITLNGNSNANGINLITNSFISFNSGSGFTERMRITSGGNVGIGTTDASALISGTERVLKISSAGVASLYLESGAAGRTWANFINTTGSLIWYDIGASAERMRITSGGRVGIGTSSPSGSVVFHVYDGSANGDVALFESNITKADIWLKDANTSSGAVRLRSESNSLVLTSGGAERMRIASDGAIQMRNVYNRQTSSYTLVLADAGKVVEMNVGSANNVTVPPNSSVAFPIGTEIFVMQYGSGQTSFVAGSGVTIRSRAGQLKIGSPYTGACLLKVGTDEWYLVGTLVA